MPTPRTLVLIGPRNMTGADLVNRWEKGHAFKIQTVHTEASGFCSKRDLNDAIRQGYTEIVAEAEASRNTGCDRAVLWKDTSISAFPTLEEIADRNYPGPEEVADALQAAAFALECAAHLRGLEGELLPVAKATRTMIARVKGLA